jgi:glycerol-3-phosphate dehydrogenase (NAD(P)+)
VGVFGFAITYHISNHIEKGSATIKVFDKAGHILESLKNDGTHPLHSREYCISGRVKVVGSARDLYDECDLVVLAVPGQGLREVVRENGTHFPENVVLLSLIKSLEKGTGYRMSQIVAEELPANLDYSYVQLSGGMFAEDILKSYPLGASIACKEIEVAKKLSREIFSHRIHIFPTTDVAGVEYAGALKNIVAILGGICNGLGYSIGSETFLISQAAREIESFAISRGASSETFSMDSPAWGNDLWMTCFGNSRNRSFGQLVGQGMEPGKALEKMIAENRLVEGYYTLQTFHNLVKDDLEQYPMISTLHEIVYGSESPTSGIDSIMKKL